MQQRTKGRKICFSSARQVGSCRGVLMKMKRLVLCAIVAFLIVLLICSNIQKKHTITLSNGEGTIKAEQIQLLWGTVKVSGDSDTDVVFTDIETGEHYIIGYITHGVTEKINLEKDKWYKVEGGGNLTLYPVNIRVE